MLLIPCPWCGPRDEAEFGYGGDVAAAADRAVPATVGDANWADRLYLRTNPHGWHDEYWLHRHGCGRWFVARRHMVTHAIAGTAPPGGELPEPAPPDGGLPDPKPTAGGGTAG